MKICTFFGHRDTPDDIKPILEQILVDLIENKNVSLFYVGLEGNFDGIVIKALKELVKKYPHIKYYVVLAYMPKERDEDMFLEKYETIYPDELEKTPLRFAIHKRNRWMVLKSDYVVTYIRRNIGGAAIFKELAEKKNKNVINIYDIL